MPRRPRGISRWVRGGALVLASYAAGYVVLRTADELVIVRASGREFVLLHAEGCPHCSGPDDALGSALWQLRRTLEIAYRPCALLEELWLNAR